jgi:hypothetical protein
MGKTIYIAVVLAVIVLSTQTIAAKVYEVPPSSVTRSSVPVISDEAMRACVILYNDAKDLQGIINSIIMSVNQYSKASVDTYNRKVNKYSQMINKFNRNCAGKQSESARKAAEKLNRQNSL